jgi:hypothetical protein
MVHDVLQRPFLALVEHRALDGLAVADRAVVETAGHPGISHHPAGAHGLGKGRVVRDPVVDGARGDIEEARELLVGGAQQAVIVRELAELTAVGSGTAGSGHNSI